jgi:sortase B
VFLDVDCDADFGETNNVVYGHFMWDGSMFHDIRSYRDPAFFAAHPKGVLITPEKAYEIVFFSGYVSDTLAGAWDIHFSQEGYEDWLSELIEKSVFDAGVDVSGEDRVLTLSTCSYEFTEARFVLHGKILEDE